MGNAKKKKTFTYRHTCNILTFPGNCMRLEALSYVYGGQYAAFTSPPISKDHDYCFLVFYYKILRDRDESLSVYIEDINSKNLTILWSADENTFDWKKIVLKFPSMSSNCSVIFLGYIGYSSSYWYGPYRLVFVDDIRFKSCGSGKLVNLIWNVCRCFRGDLQTNSCTIKGT